MTRLVSSVADQCLSDLLIYPPDTEAQKKLGIRCDFGPAPVTKWQDDMNILRCMISQADDWGKAPLTEEFVSKLGQVILHRDLEEMRGRAVSNHPDASNEGSLPIIINRPASHVRSYIISYPGNKFNDKAIAASRKRKLQRDAAVRDGLIALAFRVARVGLLPIRCSYLGSAFLLCVLS